jgi:hypothetical protein
LFEWFAFHVDPFRGVDQCDNELENGEGSFCMGFDSPSMAADLNAHKLWDVIPTAWLREAIEKGV